MKKAQTKTETKGIVELDLTELAMAAGGRRLTLDEYCGGEPPKKKQKG